MKFVNISNFLKEFLLIGIGFLLIFFAQLGLDFFDISQEYVTIFVDYSHVIGMSLVIFGSVALLGHILKIILQKALKKHSKYHFLTNFLTKTFTVIKYFAVLYYIAHTGFLSANTEKFILKIYSVSIIFVFLILFTGFIKRFFNSGVVQSNKLNSLNRSLMPFLKKVAIAALWGIGIIVILGNLGVNITALIAGAGVGGIAIAFAAQKSIANMFGAVTILLNKPFEIGDFVKVNGVTGTVREIGITYITINDIDGHQVKIPNEVIISTNVENFSVRVNRKTTMSIGLIYDTTLEKMKEAVKIIESILDIYVNNDEIQDYRVNFDSFGDFSLNIEITYFSLINDNYTTYLKQKEEINLKIKNKFQEAGLSMAFPTQELIMKMEGNIGKDSK